MSALDDIASRATACAIDTCWRQWRALADLGLPAGTPPVTAIIDAEALVLLSLSVHDHERRLDDQLRWWASEASTLMSVQRMRTMLADYPEDLRHDVAWFAAMAVRSGDARWKSLADGPAEGGRPGKGPRELRLAGPAALMLRLRAGFGVGAKADLLAFLIGVASSRSEHSSWATVGVIANAICYSVASTRRAASDMALARLVKPSADRPVRYSADVRAWARLLELREPYAAVAEGAAGDRADHGVPAWRFWAQVFAFLATCSALESDPRMADTAPVVRASHLRDLAERHRRPLEWNGIPWIDPRMFPGERYLQAFEQLLDSVIAWTAERV